MPADYTLPDVLNTQGAGDMLDAISACRGNDLAVDASGVRHLGAQAMQILLAAQTTWDVDQKHFHLCNISDEMRRGLELLGADGVLREGAAP